MSSYHKLWYTLWHNSRMHLRRVGPVSGLPLCPAREAHDRNNASRLGTVKPVVSCDLATRTNNASTTHEPTRWLFATSSPPHLPRPSGTWPRAGRGVGGLPRQGRTARPRAGSRRRSGRRGGGRSPPVG